ncbi:sialin-like [Sitophilus oryzae]|uniref:Sialin-like n=1 Tax=Sitophilus oryzae TaxID=7048 RepID=A0A6J2X6R1_SITOR|nr:sialin-like [Sitophilus oryzae]XP_030746866.1 sialin-like [Sitophilus oryzae]
MAFIKLQNKNLVPIRALIWVMLFTCTFVLYMLRTNLSIIILAMVSTKGNNSTSTIIPECILKNSNYTVTKYSNLTNLEQESLIHSVQYEWSPQLQGLILGAYFWGFVIAGIPAAAVAEKFGPRICVTISFLASTVLTLLGPLCASIHPNLLIASRFFIGLFGAIIYPAIHCLISKWAPPSEKGKFISATLGGSLGTVITWPLLGSVIDSLGWEWAFYITGLIVLAWTFAWLFLVHDTPQNHPWITSEEKEHIDTSLAGTISNKSRIPPYKSIAASLPAWALFIAQFGNLWGLFFLMTAGPYFMSTVLGFNIGHTGMLAALPYLARMLAGFVFGGVGDFILRRKLMSKTEIRKSFTILSHLIPGVLLLAQTFAGCHINWAVILLTLSLASNGAGTITNLSNAQDLAPNFAGTIYGIANCIGSTTGFISPMVVGYLTSEHNGMHEWHRIFYIGALVYVACGVFFIIFGKGEIQDWNYDEEDRKKDVESSLKEVQGVENKAFDKDGESK